MAWVEKYVRADATGGGTGDNDTVGDAWTIYEAASAAVASQRVNVRAGTYDIDSGELNFLNSGTDAGRIWYRGFNSTPGDLDNDFVTARPNIDSSGSDNARLSGAFTSFSNVNFRVPAGSSQTAIFVWVTATQGSFHRCRFLIENGGAGPRVELSSSGSFAVFSECSFVNDPQSAGRLLHLNSGTNIMIDKCYFEGSFTGVDNFGRTGQAVINTVITGGNGNGINCTQSQTPIVIGNTIFNMGGDGLSLLTGSEARVIGNLFSENGGYGIDANGGISGSHIFRNAFYSNSNGTINPLAGDVPEILSLNEVARPTTSLTDPTLVAGALSVGSGMDNFDGQSFSSFLDRGASQIEATGGGPSGGLLVNPAMTGGIRG